MAFLGELISELTSGYISDIFGRVIIMKISSYIGSIFFFLSLFLNGFLKSIFIMIGMLGFSATFTVISVYTPEIFAPKLRGTVCGFLVLVMRIGPLFVPLFTNLFGNGVYFLMAGCGFINGVLCNFLEETLGKKLKIVFLKKVIMILKVILLIVLMRVLKVIILKAKKFKL